MTAPLSADKPTIKILIYTDDPQVSASSLPGDFFGIGSMLDRLQAHAPAFAHLKTELVCRNSTPATHADNKINVVLDREAATGEPFDEIWFFGLHQANIERFSVGAFRGGPNSELDADEVAALEKWMNTRDSGHGGGVLITGDHASPPPLRLIATPNSPCGDTSAAADVLGLGRAIGRCVPRAGALRRWEGPPTIQDSFSTIADAGVQLDRFPQQLILRDVNIDGDPDDNGTPHPLFFYRADQVIRAFPDHGHEGAVVIPDAFEAGVWPDGPNGQVRPQVVALGTDRRRTTPLNIVATYNGDLAGVGRIVADSTWHHYMNLNLRGFAHPAPIGSVADQIGQFYGNLAIWLAPRSKRIQMARAMSWELARYTLLLEERDPEHLENMGTLAQSLLAQVASPCEIHELMRVIQFTEPAASPGATETMADDVPVDQDLYLGFYLNMYHDLMIEAETDSATEGEGENAPITFDSLIEATFRQTREEQEKRLRRRLEALNAANPNN